MNPDLTRSETLIEDGHAESSAIYVEHLGRIHNIFRDTLKALTASAIKNHVMLSKSELEQAMEGVGESLSNEADYALAHLPNESYTPANAKKLIEESHRKIVEALQVKPIDWSGTFEKIFRPESTRGSAPTNPAMLLSKGNDL